MNRKKKRPPNIPADPNDILLAAVTVALALAKGRSQYEIETLINLNMMITNNLQAYLRQMAVNEDNAENTEIDIDL